MMVYGLNVKPEHGYYVDFDPLDGDVCKIKLLDETPDEGATHEGAHSPLGGQWTQPTSRRRCSGKIGAGIRCPTSTTALS
jgi:hypothetical protein